MIKKLLSQVVLITLARIVPPLILLSILTLHSYHSLSEVMDQQYYIWMYLVIILALIFIETSVRAGICEPLEALGKKVFMAIDVLSFSFAVLVNVFAFYITHNTLQKDDPRYWFGLFAIVLISLMFEMIVRLVFHIRFKKTEIEPPKNL